MGAMPGNRAWHVYKRGLGPTPDQLFMQSNFGIVTKMGVWLMPSPEVYMPLWLRLRNDDDLGPAMDTLRQLMLDDTIRMVPQLLSAPAARLGAVGADAVVGGGGADPGRRASTGWRASSTSGAGRCASRSTATRRWSTTASRRSRRRSSASRARTSTGTKCAPEDIAQLEHPVERVQGGVPSLDLNQMTAWYGGEEGGHIGFSPVAPLTGPDAMALRDLLRGMIESAGLDYMAALIPINARSFIHVTLIIFDTKNEAQTRAAYDVAKRLVRDAAKLGYGEYRAHLDFMDLAAEQYSFDDHAYMRFCETIKDALDPNGILAPGKSGIWPKSMR